MCSHVGERPTQIKSQRENLYTAGPRSRWFVEPVECTVSTELEVRPISCPVSHVGKSPVKGDW